MEYDNSNRGAIWGNKKKATENHPDYTGEINVNGVDYWLSGWKRKEGASPSSPAMSFSVRAKEDQQIQQSTAPAPAGVDDDENLPF